MFLKNFLWQLFRETFVEGMVWVFFALSFGFFVWLSATYGLTFGLLFITGTLGVITAACLLGYKLLSNIFTKN